MSDNLPTSKTPPPPPSRRNDKKGKWERLMPICIIIIAAIIVSIIAGINDYYSPSQVAARMTCDDWEKLIRDNDIEEVRDMVKAGANVNIANDHGKTPLFWAARKGRTEIVALLLVAGADVKTANDFISPTNAVFSRREFEAKYGEIHNLLNAADLAQKDGTPLLAWAAKKGRTDIVKLLIEAGANVNVTNKNGSTPLHIAADHGHTEIVKLLIEKEANVNMANKYGLTPLYFAAQNGHTK